MAEDPEGLTVVGLLTWAAPVVAGWLVSGLVLVAVVATLVAYLEGDGDALWGTFVQQMLVSVVVPPLVMGFPWALVLRVTRSWPFALSLLAGAVFSCAMGAADGLMVLALARLGDARPFLPMALSAVGGGGAVCFGLCARLEAMGRPRWPGVVLSLPISAALAVLALFASV